MTSNIGISIIPLIGEQRQEKNTATPQVIEKGDKKGRGREKLKKRKEEGRTMGNNTRQVYIVQFERNTTCSHGKVVI